MKLYLLALIPPDPVCDDIRRLKLDMKSRFGSGHALKAPAHITLQMPFRKQEADEATFSGALSRFSAGQNPFTLRLSGFGCFQPRVLFVRVMPAEPVRSLHHELKPVLKQDIGIPEKQISESITPHMTIATRDLTEAQFERAWPEFRDKPYEAEFTVNALYLLKHNGKFWDVHREYPF